MQNVKDFARMPMDPRMVREIQQSPAMMQEQNGSGQFVEKWGGPEVYKVMSRLDEKTRLTYAAVLAGAGTYTEIKDLTGLVDKDVASSTTFLVSQGFVPSDSLIDDSKVIAEEI